MSNQSYHHPHNQKFQIGALLNIGFIIAEIFYGIQSNSMALIADAAHNAGDVLGLFIAWSGYLLANRSAPTKFTFGFKKATILAAFINAILLFIAFVGIVWEAFERWGQYEAISSLTVIIVAGVGILINGFTAYLFSHDKDHDINIRGTFLHMALDTAVSLGVVVGGILILWLSWAWVDSMISFIIAVIIFASSWKLFKESLNLMLLAVPETVDLRQLEQLLDQEPGLIGYHDLHIWPLSTTEIALSAHLIVNETSFNHRFTHQLEKKIQERFPIFHVTLQLELHEGQFSCSTNCSG